MKSIVFSPACLMSFVRLLSLEIHPCFVDTVPKKMFVDFCFFIFVTKTICFKWKLKNICKLLSLHLCSDTVDIWSKLPTLPVLIVTHAVAIERKTIGLKIKSSRSIAFLHANDRNCGFLLQHPSNELELMSHSQHCFDFCLDLHTFGKGRKTTDCKIKIELQILVTQHDHRECGKKHLLSPAGRKLNSEGFSALISGH